MLVDGLGGLIVDEHVAFLLALNVAILFHDVLHLSTVSFEEVSSEAL